MLIYPWPTLVYQESTLVSHVYSVQLPNTCPLSLATTASCCSTKGKGQRTTSYSGTTWRGWPGQEEDFQQSQISPFGKPPGRYLLKTPDNQQELCFGISFELVGFGGRCWGIFPKWPSYDRVSGWEWSMHDRYRKLVYLWPFFQYRSCTWLSSPKNRGGLFEKYDWNKNAPQPCYYFQGLFHQKGLDMRKKSSTY